MTKDGGQAFPVAASNGHTEGMTLRDYFAGQALTGLLAHLNSSVGVSICYEWADAMIAERNKNE